MNSMARIVAPPLFVLILGAGLAAVFVLTRPTPKRTAAKPLPPRVEVRDIIQEARVAEVEALGSVVPARRVNLRPEVSGVVRYVHPQLEAGGWISAKDILLRIDNRNFRLDVAQKKAQVAKAEFDLQLELGRQRVAKKEWELLERRTRGEADEALALRQPHLKNAQAALEAAKSMLGRARLDLSRSTIRAPFEAFVQDEQVEVGQLVGPTNTIATLVGTEAFWVQVSLPVEDLALVETPDGGDASGSPAQVIQSLGGGRSIERRGRVLRLLGDLDPLGKMARVIIEIEDPLNRDRETDELPLLLGSVVRVRIAGRRLEGVYAIPRLALHQGRQVWLVEEGRLSIRDVEVAWRGRREVYVRGDLGSTARVVTSRLQTPVAGMAVRLDAAAASAEAR